ncbi:PEP-CTERM sorting domain-containing protein [Methylobacillus gramineus]|uniref:PEP-CTERM sorting domain-containing protein n=1 Tax=Methylobacillus gramineus TaxID=755169 RepID=UPI001CFF71CA|nr:PEP-CTERM sorting domain-containing protein [Methylobacillus gramineus]MCB5184033.1 PEP-CTERM sorting domain-containing protein [Methylobacillus gramineus]
MKLHLIAATVCMLLASNVHATSLSGNLTADNEFKLYISTDADVLGTLIAIGNNWSSTFSFSNAPLVAGQDYFLQVVATDWGRPEAFIGEFSLSDSGFIFANGTQHLLTNVNDWAAGNGPASSWEAPTGTPVDHGNNGSSPWGSVSNISSEARWIWAPEYGEGTAYFSTQLIAAIPEPSSYALMLAGLALVGFAGRKSNKN